MAKLTAEQEAQLVELERLRDAPEGSGGGGRDLSLIIDLGDEKAVKRALALGVLDRGDLDEFDTPGGAGEGGEGEGGEGAGGKGGKAGKGGEGGAGGEGNPRRRLSIADKALGNVE